MAARPVTSTGSEPVDPTEAVEALRAERDELLARAEEAERVAEELAEELGRARARLAAQPPHADPAETVDTSKLTLFDEAETEEAPLRPVGAGEPGVLPITIAAIATVALVAGLTSLFNRGLLDPFTLAMLAVGIGLGRVAWLTRVVRVEVTVDDGIVTVVRGDTTHRFDLRSETTRVQTSGRPGDADWRIRFYRRGLDPIDLDARIVEPESFLAKLREYRPAL